MKSFIAIDKHIIIKISVVFLVVFSIYSFTYITLALIPFHPDESTQLYMSSDFDNFISDPLSMVWKTEKNIDTHQKYRELDAPLTRYIIGFGRNIFHIPALVSDWDWSSSWEHNSKIGALPTMRQLLISRGSITFFLPISILLIFWLGKKVNGNFTAIIAALLLLFNPLVLLHCRRGMAEGILLFTTLLALIGIILGERYTWLTGLTIGLAFNAKQSAIALFPVGLLSVWWNTHYPNRKLFQFFIEGLIYITTFILVFFLLNPLYWTNPLNTMKESLKSRQQLLKNQIEDRREIAPDYILDTPFERAIVPLAHLFFTKLSFSEVGNYYEYTSPSEKKYQELFYNSSRSFLVGSLLFFFMLFGVVMMIIQFPKFSKSKQRIIALIFISFLAQYFFFILFIPLPWQRYAISLVPYACIFSAIGIEEIGRIIGIIASKIKPLFGFPINQILGD